MSRYRTFEEFWPFYMTQHSHPTNRVCHFVGTTMALNCLVFAIFTTYWMLLAAPVLGYGLAWTGHFLFEKNKPATFQYPLWSLRADFRMFFLILTGRIR